MQRLGSIGVLCAAWWSAGVALADVSESEKLLGAYASEHAALFLWHKEKRENGKQKSADIYVEVFKLPGLKTYKLGGGRWRPSGFEEGRALARKLYAAPRGGQVGGLEKLDSEHCTLVKRDGSLFLKLGALERALDVSPSGDYEHCYRAASHLFIISSTTVVHDEGEYNGHKQTILATSLTKIANAENSLGFDAYKQENYAEAIDAFRRRAAVRPQAQARKLQPGLHAQLDRGQVR